MNHKEVILFLLAFLSIIITSCEKHYKVKKDSVYLIYCNEGSGYHKIPVIGADAKTFEVLELGHPYLFGRDKNNIYIDEENLEGADPASFEYLGNNFFRDKNRTYHSHCYGSVKITICPIPGVDPDKIKLIKGNWAKAGNILIFCNDTLTLSDIESFKLIKGDYGKTNTQILFETKVIKEADLATFEVVDYIRAKDKNHYYEYGIIKDNK